MWCMLRSEKDSSWNNDTKNLIMCMKITNLHCQIALLPGSCTLCKILPATIMATQEVWVEGRTISEEPQCNWKHLPDGTKCHQWLLLQDGSSSVDYEERIRLSAPLGRCCVTFTIFPWHTDCALKWLLKRSCKCRGTKHLWEASLPKRLFYLEW